ncbi:MAG: LPS assembly protein LptD, partial [Alphaproteobacteria bacterium]|nr:LPS assembly protein LptD [Alphaproteobacteria bacterium]
MANTAAQISPEISQASNDDENIQFSADNLIHDKDNSLTIARGNVEISYRGEVLLADEITFNRAAEQISAKGNISFLQKNGDVLFSDNLALKTDFMSGAAENVRVLMSDDSRAAAAKMRREGGRFTIFEKGVYSPCKPCEENPKKPLVWQLKANEIRHDTKQQRVEYKDAYIELFGIPIAYTPYLSHPDPTRKKATGFLSPNYGSNGDLGTFIETPYYIDTSPSSDFILSPLWYTSENQFLLSGKYRRQTSNGQFEVSASGTQTDGIGSYTSGEEEFRGHLTADGLFDIDSTWRWGIDAARSTDKTYLKRYNFEGHDTTLTSNIFMEGFRHKNYMAANAYTFQNLRSSRDDDEVPDFVGTGEYNFVGEPSRHGDYWTLDGSFLSIMRSNSNDTQRVHGKAAWNLPTTLDTGDIYTLSASLQSSLYYVSSQDVGSTTPKYSGVRGQYMPQVSLKWQYPLARKHGTVTEVFEPIAAFYVAPNVGNRTKIPNEDSLDFQFSDSNLFTENKFDGVDRFTGGHHIDYGFKWSVQGASGGSSHFFIGQSYRLRKDSAMPEKSGLEDHFSDYVGRARISPNNFIDLLYRFRLAKESFEPRQSDFDLIIGPESLRLNLDYNFIGREADTGNLGDREQVGASISTKLSRYWSSQLYGTHRLSNPSGMMTAGTSFKYEDECFTFNIDFKRSRFEDQD